jgi:nucleotide-binding universal stress UspA family protein
MKHNRILVALSLAEGRDVAFERALALAKRSSAELYLVHAVPADRPFSFRATERLERSADLRKRAKAAGVNAQTVEQHGDPAEIIVLHANTQPVDLVVLGNERQTGWARFGRRSVAERVLRRTKRPTLVVPSNAADTAAFKNVLIAVDLSPASKAVIDVSLEVLGSSIRQLTAIHAVVGLAVADAFRNRAEWIGLEYGPMVISDARRRLKSVVPSNIGVDVTPKLRTPIGPAAETISAFAAQLNVDLIVLGRTKRFMQLGSTAVRVLHHTDRALLVIPPSEVAQAVDAEHVIVQAA